MWDWAVGIWPGYGIGCSAVVVVAVQAVVVGVLEFDANSAR